MRALGTANAQGCSKLRKEQYRDWQGLPRPTKKHLNKKRD